MSLDQIISAGTSYASVGNVVFSNSNGVSFGANGQTITASFSGGGAGGGAALQGSGTYTQNTGTIQFNNSNGVTFGLTAGQMTASVATNYLTTAAQSNQVVNSLNGSTGQISLNVGSSLSASTNGSSITFGLASNITTALQSTGAYLTTAMLSNAATISNINISGGTTSSNLSNFKLIDSNGISWSLDTGSKIYATVATNYQSQGAYLTTAMLSNANTSFVGLNSALTANRVSATINSSGISLNFPAFLTTADLSENSSKYLQNWKLTGNSAGTQSSAQGTDLWLAGGNGVTLSGSSNSISFSVATNYQSQGAYLTTAMVSNASTNFAGIGSAITNGTMTFNTAGLSLNLSNHLTTAMLSNAGSVQISAGTDSLFTAGTITFGNANNHSFVTSNGSIIISKEADIYINGWSLAGNNTGGTTTSNLTTEGQIFFSGGANVTLSGNSNTIVINGAAPGGTTFYTGSYWENLGYVQGTSSFTMGSTIAHVQPLIIPYALSVSYIRIPASFGNMTSTTVGYTAGSSSFYYYQSYNAVLYSQGTGASSRSLQSVTSSYGAVTEAYLFSISNAGTNESIAYQITYPSEGNNTNNIGTTMVTTAGGASIFLHSTGVMTNFSGIHWMDIPFANSIAPGNYWIAINRSTSSTTSGGAIVITNQVNRNISLINVTQINSNFVPLGMASAGGATASTYQWELGLGSHTVSAQGATTGSLALSSISSVANFPIIPMQFIRQA